MQNAYYYITLYHISSFDSMDYESTFCVCVCLSSFVYNNNLCICSCGHMARRDSLKGVSGDWDVNDDDDDYYDFTEEWYQ